MGRKHFTTTSNPNKQQTKPQCPHQIKAVSPQTQSARAVLRPAPQPAVTTHQEQHRQQGHARQATEQPHTCAREGGREEDEKRIERAYPRAMMEFSPTQDMKIVGWDA